MSGCSDYWWGVAWCDAVVLCCVVYKGVMWCGWCNLNALGS